MFGFKWLVLVSCLTTLISADATAARAPRKKPLPKCDQVFSTTSETADSRARADEVVEQLRAERQALVDLAQALPIAFPNQGISKKPWFEVLPRLLITAKTTPSDLVTVALVGAARMGKSTLTNAIPALARGVDTFASGDLVSLPGRRGGTTLRPLIVVPRGAGEAYERRLTDLRARYPNMRQIEDAGELLQDGPPLFTEVDTLEGFPNVVVIDTPDMTTGDQRTDAQGRNIATARDAMLAADVMVIMLDDNNVRDLGLGRILADNFKFYGYRHSIFVLRTDAETDDEFAESKNLLVDAARSFYGMRGNGGAPEGVLGMFAMPLSADVRRSKAHPELIPLGDFAPFPILMAHLATRSAEIRGYAARQAAEVIFNDLNDELRSAFRERYATDIYRMALTAAARVAPTAVEFPYQSAPDEWRDMFEAQRRHPVRATEIGARLSSLIGRKTAEGGQWLLKRGDVAPKFPLAEVITSVDVALRSSWSTRLTKITKDLQNGRVEVARGDAEVLRAHLERFNQLFPDQRVTTPRLEVAAALTSVDLPGLDLLGQKARASLDVVFRTSDAELLKRLSPPVDGAEAAETIKAQIAEGLHQILADSYQPDSKNRDFIMNAFATLAGGASGVGGAAMLGVKVAVLAASGTGVATLLGGLAVAALTRSWLEGAMDKELRPLLEGWFKTYQRAAFAAALDEKILGPIQLALETDAPADQSSALTQVQTSLRRLGAPVPEYSRR